MSLTFCPSLRTNQIGLSILFLITLSQVDVPSRHQLWILFILYKRLIRFKNFERWYILNQTHFLSGNTSHEPFSPVPPQGPFRRRLGQFWLQINAVEDNIHSPQRWQWKTGIFIRSSNRRINRDIFFSPDLIGGSLYEIKSLRIGLFILYYKIEY